jgi:Late exocytosis, associated with Golgi transport/Cytosolic domain of 10TM putative phosphate transporter
MSSDDEFSNSTGASGSSNNSTIVRVTLRLYGSLYISCFLAYVFILNKRYPRWFNVRSWADDEHASSHSDGDAPFNLAQTKYATSYSWIYQLFTLYSDDQLQQHCSMDAVCFLRALRFGRILSLMGCFNAIWLIPLYYTASDNHSPDVDPFQLMTVSNLPSYSNRFIGTVFAAYITYIYAMYLIFLEYQWFTDAKHKFLSTKSPRNYSVYVSGIPRAYRSSQQLANYFSTCSNGSVLEAHIAMETPKLDKWIERRKVVVQNLEHTIALERKTGRTSTHHRLSSRKVSLRKVESVQVFELELEQLNNKIAKAVQDILGNQCRDNISMVMGSIPSQLSIGRPLLSRNTGSKDLLRAIRADVQSDDNEDSSSEESVGEDEISEQGMLRCDYQNNLTANGTNGCDDEKIPTLEVIGEVSLEESWSKENDAVVSAEAKNESVCFGEEDDEEDSERASNDPEGDGIPDGSTRSSGDGSSRYSFRQTMMTGTNVVTGSIGKAGMSLVSSSKSAGSTIMKSSILAGTTIAKTTKVAGATLIQTASETGVETLRRAQCVGTQVVHSAGAVVPLLRSKTEGKATDAGFVVFTTLYATQTALQMVRGCFLSLAVVQILSLIYDCFYRLSNASRSITQSRKSNLISS